MANLTASDRSSLIKLASSLPAGDQTRKAILAGLKISDEKKDFKSYDGKVDVLEVGRGPGGKGWDSTIEGYVQKGKSVAQVKDWWGKYAEVFNGDAPSEGKLKALKALGLKVPAYSKEDADGVWESYSDNGMGYVTVPSGKKWDDNVDYWDLSEI